jgi:methylisocitrate lyase
VTQTRGDAFRALLAAERIAMVPAVYDPLGARIAEDVGFGGISLGGYACGAHMAVTEPLLTLDEVARITASISLVTKIPMMVDAGAGYGEPLHVMHTTRLLEQAGAGAIHIEDQAYPKRVHYHRGIEHVIPTEEMVKKIESAVAARSDMVIVARTDAMRTDGYDAGIARARAYAAAGADAVIAFPNSDEEARRAPEDLAGIPAIYVNSTGNRFGRGVFAAKDLESWGWAMVEDAISAINVSARALFDLFNRLHDTGEPGLPAEEIVAVRLRLEETIGIDRLVAIEQSTVEQSTAGPHGGPSIPGQTSAERG